MNVDRLRHSFPGVLDSGNQFKQVLLKITTILERRNKMQISTIVKDLMTEQKLTLTDLSSMSGVATSTLSDLLNNRHTPTLKTIKRVMRVLV